MAEETSDKREPAQRDAALLANVEKSRGAWRRLGWQLRETMPTDVARYLLVGGVLTAVGWLIAFAWPALVPFAVGAGLAYAVLPLVNALDRVMPRRLAALFSMIVAVGLLLLAVAAVVPALIEQFLRFVAVVPSVEEIRTYVDQLPPLLERLPDSFQDQISDSVDEASFILLRRLDAAADTLPELLAGSLLKLIGVVGAALGLLVLPTWLLLVLADQRQAKQALNRLLPAAVQPDFWAVTRILDRAFRAFFQNQVARGLIAFALTYIVTFGLNAGGYIQTEYPLVVALFVGLMELVPEIGPLVAIVVLGISGWLTSPAHGLTAVLLYVIIHRLTAAYDGARSRRMRELHPAIMVVGAVALSELGIFWFLLSVPLLTAARDLLDYTYGRLSAPPRAAGLIPGEEAQVEQASAAPGRVPLAYRRTARNRGVNL